MEEQEGRRTIMEEQEDRGIIMEEQEGRGTIMEEQLEGRGIIMEEQEGGGTIMEVQEDEIDDENPEYHYLTVIDYKYLTSTIRVANATRKPIMVRVAENETHLTGLSLGGRVGANIQGFEAGVEAKATWERKLNEVGFSLVAAKRNVDFHVSWHHTKIFVTIYEENAEKPTYDNHCHPKNKSILYTTSGLVSSDKDEPFEPIISQSEAAVLAGADPKLKGKIKYECAVDRDTGDLICWEADEKEANKTGKKKIKK